MKRKNSTRLILILICVSMISFGHSSFEQSVGRSDSKEAPDYEIVDIEALNISLCLVDDWRIKKKITSNTIEIQHLNSNSTVAISTTDSKVLLNEIFSKAREKENEESENGCNDCVSPEMLVKMVGVVGSFPNGKVKISTESSTAADGYEVISVRTVINKLGFLVNGKLDQNCSDCKSEFEYMVKSIEELK
jgi:hypothetical protein